MTEKKSETKSEAKPSGAGKRPCPICAKPSVEKFRPFCSARCKQVDLSRWLGGVYAIPGEPAPMNGASQSAPDDDGDDEEY